MTGFLQQFADVLASDATLGIALLLTGALLWRANRGFIRDLANDPEGRWRAIATFSFATTIAFVAWATLFDDWLQLLSEPYRLAQRWPSDREVLDPVAIELRIVSLILLGLSLIGAACLFARHVGGYVLQVALLLLAIVIWGPLFVVRQRFDLIVFDGVAENPERWSEFAGLALFWILRVPLTTLSLLSTYVLLLMLIAPVVTLILDLFRMRTPPDARDAEGYYAALRDHSADHPDIPLKTLWRPIRRPS